MLGALFTGEPGLLAGIGREAHAYNRHPTPCALVVVELVFHRILFAFGVAIEECSHRYVVTFVPCSHAQLSLHLPAFRRIGNGLAGCDELVEGIAAGGTRHITLHTEGTLEFMPILPIRRAAKFSVLITPTC
ncbi:hypothetical protein D3C80_1149760 [compost metagenome]